MLLLTGFFNNFAASFLTAKTKAASNCEVEFPLLCEMVIRCLGG
jgi:hypothetical protein